ncbi:MAG TPA: HAD family hydrolase [Streptosporangiaceae bacterium]|nr:HAD family hydrolase [Streptosporangiaceae bacterium]
MAERPGITLACCGLLGTLVAETGLIERSFAEAIATQGVVSGTSAFARRMAQVHQARGRAPGDVMRLLFPENEARAQAAQLAFDRALPDAIGRAVMRPLPGAVQVLERLREAGCRVCVITSLSRRVLDLVLDTAGLRRRVDLTLAAEDVPRGFPAPDLVLTAILRTEAAAVQDVAVVHGTSAGIEAGRRAGAGVIAGVMTGPHSPARLRAAGATSIIPSIAELPALLADGVATAGTASAKANGSNDKPPGPPAEPPAVVIDVPPQTPVERRTSDR